MNAKLEVPSGWGEEFFLSETSSIAVDNLRSFHKKIKVKKFINRKGIQV